MKNLLKVLAISVLLCSCASEQKQNAANEVAKIWGAQNATVGFKSSVSTEQGSNKTLSLTLENLGGVKSDYPNENITSVSALTFINNLPATEFQDYDHIKIAVKNNSTLFEKTYKLSDILLAIDVYKTIDQFAVKVKNGNLSGLENLFDKQHVPDSTLAQLKQAITGIEATAGRPTKATVVRFDFKELEETKDPVTVWYLELSNNTSYSSYKLILKNSDKKIVYFGLNVND